MFGSHEGVLKLKLKCKYLTQSVVAVETIRVENEFNPPKTEKAIEKSKIFRQTFFGLELRVKLIEHSD